MRYSRIRHRTESSLFPLEEAGKSSPLSGVTSMKFINPTVTRSGSFQRAYVSHVWHDFERQLREPKGIQELLRHANLKVTMDTYVQAVSDEKRKVQSKVEGGLA